MALDDLVESDLIKEDQEMVLLRLPKDNYSPDTFRQDNVTIGSIFEQQSLVQEIKVVGQNKQESLHLALVCEEGKSQPGKKFQEVLKVHNEVSSTLQFLFRIYFPNLFDNLVATNRKVFAIVIGKNWARLISEGLYKFIAKGLPKAQEQ